jgi:hypothetical protein
MRQTDRIQTTALIDVDIVDAGRLDAHLHFVFGWCRYCYILKQQHFGATGMLHHDRSTHVLSPINRLTARYAG